MKKTKMVKMLAANMLALSLLVSELSVQSVYADAEEATVMDSEDIIDALEDEAGVEVTDNEISYDEESIYDYIGNLDMDSINKEYIEYGLNPVTSEEFAEFFISGIEIVNEELDNGELVMLSDGTMVEGDDDSFYLQGGSTYDKTYWWGKRRYKSTAAANKWVRDLNKTAAIEGGAGAIGGTVFGNIPIVVGSFCCAYCWCLATDVAYYNSLSNRGIKADIPWALVGYKVRKQ